MNYLAAGKVVSQKKDELNHILDQFNIQVSWAGVTRSQLMQRLSDKGPVYPML